MYADENKLKQKELKNTEHIKGLSTFTEFV